ncbi:hypothetical protein GCM10010326_23650 [Streptomyces xanthochromogenes]|uniref:Uncharacterized protein n=1 Tax=Streptomyces xanthochromogenes TaxID=67384 RepID=A0ABQ2ZY40_9ACTN|nr:hypothetical protein GCM10010326_23650 [Streptomyces xanthochromogenes]
MLVPELVLPSLVSLVAPLPSVLPLLLLLLLLLLELPLLLCELEQPPPEL